MRSVADALRADTSRASADLTPEQRLELALRMGDEDVARYCAARGVTTHEARVAFARARAVGRRPSVANEHA